MFKKILIVFAVAVLAFVATVALQPPDFRIARSATISAPADAVFAQVNDLRRWEDWSPWAKLDPAVKNTFEGPAAGKGAVFMWSGNNEVGEGRMTITESRPNELIRIKLDFIKPFESTCTTEFSFKPENEKTAVTWTMFGTHGFVEKAFCLFMDMDKMVGGDFEKGLAQLESVVKEDAKS